MIIPSFTRVPWKQLLIGVAILALIFGLMSWRAACTSADRAREEAGLAQATGTALDTAAADTAAVRQSQEETQREVDEIPGADQRLPDGFGADLERVRRGAGQPRNP